MTLTDINLLDFGKTLGAALGIGDFGGGLLATTIFLFATFACLGALTRKRPAPLEILFLTLPVLGFCVFCGWAPVWLFVMLVVITALMIAGRLPRIFGG